MEGSSDKGALARGRDFLRSFGMRLTLHRALLYLEYSFVRKAFRSVLTPTLMDFQSSGDVYLDPTLLVANLSGANKERLQDIALEYNGLSRVLLDRYHKAKPNYPESWKLKSSFSLFVYLLCRVVRPKITIETGVANGDSSFFVINALLKNSSGTLYSTDIGRNVGALITDEERQVWHLKMLEANRIKKSFSVFMESLGELDLFVHDSEHSYSWQLFELESAYKHAHVGSYICSDDVDSSYAFIDFARRHRLRTFALICPSGIFGVVRK